VGRVHYWKPISFVADEEILHNKEPNYIRTCAFHLLSPTTDECSIEHLLTDSVHREMAHPVVGGKNPC